MTFSDDATSLKSVLQEPIMIIGTGAIASWIGGCLARQVDTLGFIGRQGPQSHAFALEVDGQVQTHAFAAPSAAQLQAARIVFIAVKAFDLAAALQHTQLLTPGCCVIPVVNGAVWERIAHQQANQPELIWRLGFASVGVSALASQHYALRSAAGSLDFGPLPKQVQTLQAAEADLVQHWPALKWHTNILPRQQRKWLYNTVINSLCAAHGLANNGALLADLPMLVAVFDEAYRYACERWGGYPQTREQLYQGMLSLIEATQTNENSMARDVRLQRRTEDDFLAGLVARANDAVTRYPLLVELHRWISTAVVEY